MHRNLIHFFHPFFIKRSVLLISWSRDVIVLTVSGGFIVFPVVIQQLSFFWYFSSSLFSLPQRITGHPLPNNYNSKTQTKTKPHNQRKKKGWASSESLTKLIDLEYFSHHLFYLHFSPSYIETKHTKLNQIDPSATNTHTSLHQLLLCLNLYSK